MNSTMILGVASAILLFGGLIAIWWLTGRIGFRFLRALLRIVAIPVFAILIVLFSLTMLRTSSNLLPQAKPVVVTPLETMTVQPGTLTQTLSATGALTPANDTSLAFSVNAPVTQVLVSAGDQVHKGDVLARVDTTSIESQIRSAQINLTQAQNSLNELKAPPSDIDVKLDQLAIDSAQASLSSASQTGPTTEDVQIANLQAELAKNSLWQAQLSRDEANAAARPNAPNAYANQIQTNASLAQDEMQVTQAQNSAVTTASQGPNEGQLASANASLTQAQANLNALLAGASDSDIKQAEIGVQTAQLALDSAQRQLSNAVLVAPFDGIVATVNIVPGELPPGTGAMTMIDTSSYTITVSVDEKDIPQLAVGQAVNVTVQALQSRETLPGTVTRVDPVPVTSSNGLVTYNVEVTLNTGNQPLRPGMSSVASIVLKQLNNVLVVPNRFVTTNAATGKSTVKVETAPNTYVDVPVTLGTVTDTDSEIVSGVSIGQTLVILPAAGSTTAGGRAGLFGGGGGFGGPPGGFAGGGGGFAGGGGGFAGGARTTGRGG